MSIVATKTVNELPSTQSQDHAMMAIALTLGRRGLGRTWPNPAVGAVVVRDTEAGPIVVGRGWTQAGGRPHAEIEALRRTGEDARDATLYVTLEPCSHHGKSPPCVDAIIAAGVSRVVSSIEDPNPNVAGAGHQRLRDAGIRVEIGQGAAQARRDHAGHIRRMRDSRPHVILKLALSAEDKIGLPGRRIQITGERARDRVHLLRAQCDAVLIGIGTALADDPLLTCRLPGLEGASPVRIVLDTNLRLPPTSRLVQTARETPVWVFASSDADSKKGAALRETGIEILDSPIRDGRIDLQAALALLSDGGITRLLVEGGARVAADFVAHDLVDEAHLYRAAIPIGADGIDALAGMHIAAITQSPRFVALESETIGDDALQHFERQT